ncbi:helix-turn-helix transcriptional regulator [Micromonospora rubida]|uniref:helix-turn-helix transcriptional regulator n=1 Tax=Micromonospora rubida TaxID=2697657 RepID=UPI001378305F|nr:LuxR family transcriptional regulator [Micromonospora rubida]NBE81543.1 hypothetical protein [Micromonospora rubida]
MREDHQPLRILGLSDLDQSWYESLVVAGATEITGNGDPASMARLEAAGLIVRLTAEEPARWAVVPPDIALDPLLAERRRWLHDDRQRLAVLAERFRGRAGSDTDPSQLVELIHGPDAVFQASEELIRGIRNEARVFDAPPYARDPLECNPTELEQLRRGVRWRAIYDRQAVAVPGRLAHLSHAIAAGEQARITTVPMKLLLGDQPLAMVPLRLQPVDIACTLLVRDSTLLSALSALFETYWERAVPFDVGIGDKPLPNEDGPSGPERALMSLLMAGLTDQATADHLGWHLRTVRRHLSALLRRLDAATRFQAGYQAVQRGWLTAEDVPAP